VTRMTAERAAQLLGVEQEMAEYRKQRVYNIVRFYRDHPSGITRRIVRKRVTLEEAQRHCNDPETSSSTAKGATARARTRRVGDWFDGYEQR
jgi:hypothetical protein